MKNKKYTVTFEIDASVADQINRLSDVPVEEIAKRYIDRWLDEGRHTMFEARRITIAWPVDWYAAMCKFWGQRKISPNLRRLIYDKLSAPKNPLPAPPEIRDDEPTERADEVRPSAEDRGTIITALIMPQSYYDRLIQVYGGGNVSRAIKLFAYFEMSRGKVAGLSEPFRMGKFLQEHDIESLFPKPTVNRKKE